MRRIPKTTSRTLFLLGLLLIAASGASAEAEKNRVQRVQFEKGRTTAVLKGTVQDHGGDEYLLGAQKGQTLSAHVSSNNHKAAIEIYGADGMMLNEGDLPDDWSGKVTVSGDNRIIVSSGAQNTNYTLEVTIR